ncbi:MAG: helix-turn-helix domain-containing protein [Pseudomonadota bacterium]
MSVTESLSRSAPNAGIRATSPDAKTILASWALFAASASAFILGFLIGDAAPPLTAVLNFVSAITCGFAWLLSRALFKVSPKHEAWVIAIIGVLFAGVAVIKLARAAGVEDQLLIVFIKQGVTLLSSTVLMLTLIEAVDGARHAAVEGERRFRLLFLIGYGTLLFFGVMVVGTLRADASVLAPQSTIQVLCACFALAGGTAATWYRLKHPLTEKTAPRRREPAAADEADPLITARLKSLLEDGHIYRDASQRIGTLAETLGTPEYKVSQSVTRGLGFANVNQMLNSYRIEDAKRRLADPAQDGLPILSIALDAGFGSIGPFNRSFKSQIGMTPGAFRTQRKEERGVAA